MSNQPMSFLRRVLFVDAASCGAMGIGMLLFAAPLANLLNLPAAALSEVGVLLAACSVLITFLAMRRSPPRIGVWAVIVLNAIWTVESFALLFTDWVSPNAFGITFIAGQALVTALLAELEYVGLRKSAAVVA